MDRGQRQIQICIIGYGFMMVEIILNFVLVSGQPGQNAF